MSLVSLSFSNRYQPVEWFINDLQLRNIFSFNFFPDLLKTIQEVFSQSNVIQGGGLQSQGGDRTAHLSFLSDFVADGRCCGLI